MEGRKGQKRINDIYTFLFNQVIFLNTITCYTCSTASETNIYKYLCYIFVLQFSNYRSISWADMYWLILAFSI